jgi:hypothetical protein
MYQWQNRYAAACKPAISRCESCLILQARLAQLAEVAGSKSVKCRFESDGEYQYAALAQPVGGNWLRTSAVGVRIPGAVPRKIKQLKSGLRETVRGSGPQSSARYGVYSRVATTLPCDGRDSGSKPGKHPKYGLKVLR